MLGIGRSVADGLVQLFEQSLEEGSRVSLRGDGGAEHSSKGDVRCKVLGLACAWSVCGAARSQCGWTVGTFLEFPCVS